MQVVSKGAPQEWLLVKVPQIRDEDTRANLTAKMLRAAIRESHLGGERAVVRKLNKTEVEGIVRARWTAGLK